MNLIGIVVSEFNHEVTEKLTHGAKSRLLEHGIEPENIKILHVPGAVEIPFTAQMLARTTHYSAIIALGAVIRGETSHYDYVCEQVSQGCQRVMLDYHLPVVFGVLTTDTEEQAFARAGGIAGNKGSEAADVALRMMRLQAQMETY